MNEKKYVLWAIPSGGGSPFLSSDYKGLYTRSEAEEIAGKSKLSQLTYVVQSEYDPPPVAKPVMKRISGQEKETENLKGQLATLKATSERQSVMLAKALKEKNDLLGKVTSTDADYYVRQIKQLQLDLGAAHTQLRAVRTLAKDFFEALGVK